MGLFCVYIGLFGVYVGLFGVQIGLFCLYIGLLCVWIGLFCVYLGSVLHGFLPSFPSQIWVSDVTFVTFFGDKKCDASHLSHFWEECDDLAHENIFFNLWRFLSHPSRKTSCFGPAGTKLCWTGSNVTIRLGLKHVFLLPSQICHLSRKREAGRPFGPRMALRSLLCIHVSLLCIHTSQ